MKFSFGKTAALTALAIGLASVGFAANYVADTSASSLEWKGSKVTGFHEGTVQLKSGMLHFADGKIEGGSFEIDLTTINTTDLSGGRKKKLDGHLRSDDFFSVDNFPTARLEVVKATPQADGGFDIEGPLTVKGITRPVTFDATLEEDGDSLRATGKVVVDRAKYNVRFRSGSFFQNLGDKLIYDDFEVDVEVVLKKA